MAKLYIKKVVAVPKMSPRNSTIDFILNYSKAFTILKGSSQNFEIILN